VYKFEFTYHWLYAASPVPEVGEVVDLIADFVVFMLDVGVLVVAGVAGVDLDKGSWVAEL